MLKIDVDVRVKPSNLINKKTSIINALLMIDIKDR